MSDNYERYVAGDPREVERTCGADRPGMFQIRCTRPAGHGPAIDAGVGAHLGVRFNRIYRWDSPVSVKQEGESRG